MISSDKKTKSDPAQKGDASSNDKAIQNTAEADSGRKETDTSAGYSRGEGQKLVSKAYKENWNLIFRTRKKR